jgi:hypothetical protein
VPTMFRRKWWARRKGAFAHPTHYDKIDVKGVQHGG